MLRFLLGVALGAAMAIGYVQWGHALQDKLNVAGKLRGNQVAAAGEGDLYDLSADEAHRRRALEVFFANRADYAAGLDSKMGHPYLEALYRRRAGLEARLLRTKWRTFDRPLSTASLRSTLERRHGTTDTATLRKLMLVDALERQPFLSSWMRRSGFSTTGDDLLDTLNRIAARPSSNVAGMVAEKRPW